MRKTVLKVASVCGVVVFVWALQLQHPSSAQPMSPWQWKQQEVEDFFRGATEVQFNGWQRLNAKVMAVVRQLVVHSGMVFRVVPAQTGNIGQAHNGGWILLDLSIVASSDKHMEFWLAHEWGHEALGHAANYVHPYGKPWTFAANSTKNEDDADAYAANFLCKAGYSVEPVLAMLESLPESPPEDNHSTGTLRARTVARAYASAGCTADVSGSSGPSAPQPSRVCRTSCTHQQHAMGDVSACVHPFHAFDLIPCQHSCLGPCAASAGT